MALCPWADYRPIPSSIVGVPVPMQEYLGMVEHVTEGQGSPYPWFSNPAAQAFSHFWIGVEGQLEQYQNTAYESWAQEAGNRTYLSCETEGYSTGYLTGPQVQTFGRLLAWSWNEHEMPKLVVTDTVGQEGLILHSDGGVPWGDHLGCPGPLRASQRTEILSIATALVWGTPKPQPISKGADMAAGDPISGGAWCCDTTGAVFTDTVGDPSGAPWLGGLNNHPNWHAGTATDPCVGIATWEGDKTDANGNGYVLFARPAGSSSPQAYHFPRSGIYRPATH